MCIRAQSRVSHLLTIMRCIVRCQQSFSSTRCCVRAPMNLHNRHIHAVYVLYTARCLYIYMYMYIDAAVLPSYIYNSGVEYNFYYVYYCEHVNREQIS